MPLAIAGAIPILLALAGVPAEAQARGRQENLPRIVLEADVPAHIIPGTGQTSVTGFRPAAGEVKSLRVLYSSGRKSINGIGLGASVWMTPAFGLAVRYTYTVLDPDVSLSATLPHPDIFGAPASFGPRDESARRREQGVEVLLSGSSRRDRRLQVRVLAGPAWLRQTALWVRDIDVQHSAAAPPSAAQIAYSGTVTQEVVLSAVGARVGVEGIYRVSRRWGLAVGASYVEARALLEQEPLSGRSVRLRLGGAQLYAGLRVGIR